MIPRSSIRLSSSSIPSGEGRFAANAAAANIAPILWYNKFETPNETMRWLDVRLENETVWLTQEQIANLFGTKRPAITKHLANIYKSGELERDGTCSILEHMGNDGRQSYRTMFYNLDAILSVENFHDRFLVIDDKALYVFGASLKGLGSKCFAFTKLDAAEIPNLKARV